MKFAETPLPGAFVIELEPHSDERGFFARSWCRNEFIEHGLNAELVQCNVSFNHKKGTLRGMHYQAQPYAETKLVRCTQGGVYDVIIDLRPDSRTFNEWFGVELSAENRKMLYIPEDFAHGFLTLADKTEVFYQMSAFYEPTAARAIRWNDSAFKIDWPGKVEIISDKDALLPDWEG